MPHTRVRIDASRALAFIAACAGALVASAASGNARPDCREWRGLGPPGLNNEVRTLATWDPDGPGPRPTCLVAAGYPFQYAGPGGEPEAIGPIAMWDGERWSSLGTRFLAPVTAMTTWDPDGDGPLAPLLVAGGRFRNPRPNDASAGPEREGVAAYDGAEWRILGAGFESEWPYYSPGVSALASWDPDDGGPMTPRLVVGGAFTRIGNERARCVALWDGDAWRPTLADGRLPAPNKFATLDRDGHGPARRDLVVWGGYSSLVRVSLLADERWSQLEFSGTVLGGLCVDSPCVVTSWDPDGGGPLGERIVIGGNFTEVDGAPVMCIAQREPAAWTPLGDGLSPALGPLRCYQLSHSSPVVSALTSWDPDGDGPEPALLVAAGGFRYSGDTSINGIATWDGVRWSPLGLGVDGWIEAMATWDADGPGPQERRLAVGGYFIRLGRFYAPYIGAWSECVPHCPGDLDGDRSVATRDLALLLIRFGDCDPGALGDLNADGVVDFLDLNIVLSAFGTAC